MYVIKCGLSLKTRNNTFLFVHHKPKVLMLCEIYIQLNSIIQPSNHILKSIIIIVNELIIKYI